MEASGEIKGSQFSGTDFRAPLSYGEAVDWLRSRQSLNEMLVHDVLLLGEFGTTFEELEQAADAVRTILRARGPSSAQRVLSRYYPLVLAEVVVAAGVHRYSQGDYWSWLHRRVGLPQQNYPTQWGELFEQVLAEYGLEQFDALRLERASRFVARILAHGGIPTYCLSDFFEHLLIPAVRSGEHRESAPVELINYWASRPSAFMVVDKPVKRFLVHGGSVAHDFLGRCLEMAEKALKGLEVPPADQLGLPPRIVDEFSEWFDRARLPKRTLTESSSVRYFKPTLSYDPWLPDALNLTLPSQEIGQSKGPLAWSVTTDSWSRRIEAVSSGSLHKNTRQIEVRIDSPFRSIEIGLSVGNEVVRVWRFIGVTKARPFLIFAPDTGRYVESLHELTPGEWWLIAPSGSSLSSRRGDNMDEIRVIERFPALAGKWSRYEGQHISLVNRDALVLSVENNRVEIPVRPPDDLAQRPMLVGGTPSPLPLILGPSQVAYQVRAPTLVLPLRLKGDRKISPSLWRVHVASVPGAQPRVDMRFTGDDPLLVSVHEHTTEVDLARFELLGTQPVGRFHLSARGPLGLDSDFEIFATSDVQVLGLHEVLAPSENEKEATTFYVIADGIVRAADPGGIVVEPSHLGYSVAVSRSIDQANLLISTQPEHGDVADVELPFRLQRLRWALTGISEHEPVFSDLPQVLGVDEIEHAETPSLVLDLPRLDETLDVAACLEDISGNVLFTYTRRPISKSRRFSLWELLDTIKNRSDYRLRLYALVWDRGAGYGPKRILVADITRSLQISDLDVSDEIGEYGRTVQFTWSEKHPITNRVLRFWPLWRPWERQPLEVSIPDDAQGCYTMVIDSTKLAPGTIALSLPSLIPGLVLGWCHRLVSKLPTSRRSRLALNQSGSPTSIRQLFTNH